jgi:hypothetical protein
MYIHNAVTQNYYDKTQYLFNKRVLPSSLDVKDVILRSWFSPTASFVFRNQINELPKNRNINGDMLMLFLNALNGKIFYSHEAMSVYNYGTLSSLSDSSKGNKIKLYQKKWNFLKFINEKTNYRYLVLTSLVYCKTKVGYVLNCIGLR